MVLTNLLKVFDSVTVTLWNTNMIINTLHVSSVSGDNFWLFSRRKKQLHVFEINLFMIQINWKSPFLLAF